jgi:ribosome biogenesis protein SLX9
MESVLAVSDNPFLRQQKTTKKEKREQKRSNLQEKVVSMGGRISKSSVRRQKRKQKQQLTSNLSDLLGSLPVETVANDNNGFVAPKPIDPSANAKKREKVVKEEISRFNQVLAQKAFRQSPFEALRGFIGKNIEKKDEFVKMEERVRKKEGMIL